VAEFLNVSPDIRIEALRQEVTRVGRGAVALVMPRGCAQLESLPRLRLLQRQSQFLGQDLALVTRDPTIRKNAARLGIPVFGSEAAVRLRRWGKGGPAPAIESNRPGTWLPEPPHWRKHNGSIDPKLAARPRLDRVRKRRVRATRRYQSSTPQWFQLAGYTFVGIFLAAFLGSFVYFVLPAATVTFVPGQRALETTLVLTADPQVEVSDLEQGLLSARLIETTVEATGTVSTTGSGWSEVDLATGRVVFTNQTNGTVRIPAGTIVSTSTGDDVDFRILEDLEIAGPLGTQAEVEIEATEPGILGNVPSNRITTVAGGLRTRVRVTNPEATTGGANARIRLVTQADRDRLLDQVYTGVREVAHERLSTELGPDEWMPEDTILTWITAQFFDQFNDEPADELNLTLRVLIQGSVINRTESEEAAMAALRSEVPERGQLVAESIRFTVEPNTVVTGRTLRYSMTASGNYVIPIDVRAVSRAVTGLNTEEAARRLHEEWLLAREPEFYQDPAWFGTLPRIARRIQVRVELSEAARSRQ
jgi:hypothetical protein